MKSVLNCGVMMIAFFSSAVGASAATAAESRVCDSKIDEGYVHIMKGTGAAARNPTLEELFDAFNSTKTLFADLKWEEERKHQPRLFIEVPGKAPVYYDFRSIPKKGKGDPRCTDQAVTGYECRLAQLRNDEATGGLPNGIKTGVQIKVPETDMDLISRVSKALGCGEILEVSGQPVLPAKASRKNVIPAIQLQAVPNKVGK